MTQQEKEDLALVEVLTHSLTQQNEDYENAPTEEHKRAVAIERSQTIATINQLLKSKKE